MRIRKAMETRKLTGTETRKAASGAKGEGKKRRLPFEPRKSRKGHP